MGQALKPYSKGAPFYNVWPARFRDGFHISTIAVYQDFAISSELPLGSSRVPQNAVLASLRRKQPGDECASAKRRRACRPRRCGGDQAHNDGAEQDEKRGGKVGLGNH